MLRNGVIPLQSLRTKFHFTLVLLLVSLFTLVLVPVDAQDSDPIPFDAPDDVDLDLIIGRVGDVEITLGEFAARVRYEQFYYYYALDVLVAQYGEDLINLNNPENQFAPQLIQVIGVLASDSLPAQAYNTLILAQIYAQEAEARGITIDECALNNSWSQQLSLGELIDCVLPEGFDEVKTNYLQMAEEFTGMSVETIENMFMNDQFALQVSNAIGAELEIIPLDAVRTRHIHVDDEVLAQEIFERLQNGEDFPTLLYEFSVDPGIQGTGGDLGTFGRGQMIPEFEEAAFGAEVGEIVGPVPTAFGYHVIEVTDQQFDIEARHILVDNEASAYQLIGLLENGVDFAELAYEFSIDFGSGQNGGSLGAFGRGQMVPEFEEAAFSAEVGEIVGPVPTDYGYHIIEVTKILDDPTLVAARHILVETNDEALTVIARLEAGEDFAELATELSIEPGAAGNGGDTLAVVSQGQQSGFYSENEMPPLLAPVFDAEVGDILSPIDTGSNSYLIVEVMEFGTILPPESELQQERDAYRIEWEAGQFSSGRIEETGLWRLYMPIPPPPSTAFEVLALLDEPIAEAVAAQEQLRAESTILNTLRELQVPDASETDASSDE
jgi:parvulin-like peptidyl-prolyl isomerase